MKTTVLIAVFLLALLYVTRGQEAERLKLAEDLLAAMKIEDSFRSGWTSYPPIPGKTDQPDPEDVSKALWLTYKPAYTRAYAEVFSADELQQLLAFYNSKIGRVFVSKTSELSKRLSSIPVAMPFLYDKKRQSDGQR